ncbi:yrdC domain-containing protein, mitochondrial [Meleagris gallopavo]|uniref:yrdC domain-containing protein, mitochondrial n=1 Tax=Meleagris gallopavo TaxID=9103 RepID=UPI000549CFA8|nr:yrdC domain-containing protein, mitochondrial [Meleagris gallopavo]
MRRIPFPVDFLYEGRAYTSPGLSVVNEAVPRVHIDSVDDINTFQCTSSKIRAMNAKRAAAAPQRWAAVGALQQGGLVAVPTDTVYGVACLAQDSRAVRSIYSLKGRNGTKPLAICLGDVENIYRYCHVNVPDELLQDLLPGPVTLVLKRSEELNKDLNPFTSLVGVRIPNHPFIRELARACPGPLALTSANVSSQASTLTVSEFQDLWPQLSLVVDGGPIGDVQSPECRLGSTVVDLSVSGKFTIIRPGCALTSTVEILRQKYGLIPESS